MKRALIHVSAVTTVAIALTACGSDSGGSEAPDASAAGCELEGETIELIVPYSPGGGYDLYARQLAPALGEELGATVVVVNEPGAGGLLATNQLLNAEPDGTSIGIFNMTGHIGSALGEVEGVEYDPQDFSYLGRISSEPDVVLVQAAGPHESFEDLANAAESTPVTFAATGPGANDYLDALVLDSVLGLNVEVVTGFAGGSEAALAMVQGQVDAHSRSLYSQLPAVTAGDARAVLVMGSEPAAELPDTPAVVELAEDDDQRALLEFHSRLIESGRSFAAPPGMTEGCLDEFRAAYETTVTDEAFVAEGEASDRPIAFSSGEDVQQEVEELMDAPQAYIDILTEAYTGG
jgi:tripartite-type tricarboxylate transporter receptor subunit TctC